MARTRGRRVIGLLRNRVSFVLFETAVTVGIVLLVGLYRYASEVSNPLPSLAINIISGLVGGVVVALVMDGHVRGLIHRAEEERAKHMAIEKTRELLIGLIKAGPTEHNPRDLQKLSIEGLLSVLRGATQGPPESLLSESELAPDDSE